VVVGVGFGGGSLGCRRGFGGWDVNVLFSGFDLLLVKQ
jgi:hypothetical protein